MNTFARTWRSYLGFLALLVLVVAGCNRQAPPAPQAALPSDDELRDRLDRVFAFTREGRHLDTKDQAAWQIVHGALVYGRDYQIYNEGQLVGALDYLLGGGALRGWTLRKADHGVMDIVEAGSLTGEGHEDQWLGYLSQVGLKPTDKLVLGGEQFTINDLITQAQWDIHDGMEATWTLMAFSTYLPLDTQWPAKDGTTWSIDRMVQMEAAQDLGESACGGTHRMYGLAVARNRYRDAGGKLTGEGDGAWEQCQKKIDAAIESARKFQQPDGSLSSNYFARPALATEVTSRISTTGHALEFLTVALSDEQLREPWVTRAVLKLVESLEITQKRDLECGALYHAVHGLDLYRQRRFGARTDADVSSEPASADQPPAATAGEPAPGKTDDKPAGNSAGDAGQ